MCIVGEALQSCGLLENHLLIHFKAPCHHSPTLYFWITIPKKSSEMQVKKSKCKIFHNILIFIYMSYTYIKSAVEATKHLSRYGI